MKSCCGSQRHHVLVARMSRRRRDRIRIAFAAVTCVGSSELVVCRRRGRSAQPGVFVHGPDVSKPQDLDDPLFDKEAGTRARGDCRRHPAEMKQELEQDDGSSCSNALGRTFAGDMGAWLAPGIPPCADSVAMSEQN
jgi:hypothetical protein